MAKELPGYKGQLGAAPWAYFKVTSQEIFDKLRAAALPNCPVCEGYGRTGELDKSLVCPCVNRPLDRFDKADKKSPGDLL